MKHLVIVLSIILFVSLTFLHPSIIEDASFNDYDYLQKLRRSHDNVTTDDKYKGWQEDGTFKSWYQKGNGSEDDKALNNIKSPSNVPSNTMSTNVPLKTNTSVKTNTPTSNSDEIKETSSKTNLIPYLLLILLIMIVIIVIYIKYV
jgi:hypothetical protein